MIKKNQLKVAVIGCGNRARVYLNLIAEQPQNFQIVAAADPIRERVKAINQLSDYSDFQSFQNADELLNSTKTADVLIIATQDNYHFEPCLKAIRKGYDIVLEKPMCNNVNEIVRLEEEAVKLGRRVILCHVLRYTSFYRRIKKIIQNGKLGNIMTLNASEGVGPWHFAHSYVRGHWAEMQNSTPTIVAKCSHDMDILHWLLERRCELVSSFGQLSFFKKENIGLSEKYPMFNSSRYLEPQMNVWLAQVCDNPDGSNKEIQQWLKTSNWGRNVFECNNTAVDHQVINLQFDGGATATFTMTAFDEGRNYEICGTRARLRAGDFYKEHIGADIIITDHATGDVTKINVMDQNPHPKYGGYHNGGDVGFIKELHQLLTSNEPPLTSISSSVHSHIIAFASEQSRSSGEIIDLKEFYHSQKSEEYALD